MVISECNVCVAVTSVVYSVWMCHMVERLELWMVERLELSKKMI